MSNFKIFIFFIYLFTLCECRIHHLDLKDDDRKIIQMSTFGFLTKGYLEVSINLFKYNESPEMDEKTKQALESNMLFGFTLDKSGSSGISAYLENAQGKNCLLKNPSGILSKEKNKNNSLSIIFFKMRFADKGMDYMTIERNGSDVLRLEVTGNKTHSVRKRNARKSPFGDDALMPRHRRAVPKPTTKAPSSIATTTSTPKTTTVKMTLPSTSSSKVMSTTGQNKLLDRVPIEKNQTGKAYTMFFRVNIKQKQEEGLYNLYFHNCPAYSSVVTVDMNVEIVERNDGTYLSAGEIPLAPLYFSFFVLYLVAGCVWITVLRKSGDDVYKLHYLMFAVVIVKSFSCMFHAVNIYYIGLEGIHEEAWAVLYYIVYLTKGFLMIITILLVGAGWAFVKHILSDKEKKLFLIIIPLQVFDNIAYIILEESEEGQEEYHLWKQIFIMIDLLCCGAILFPVVWSIRHLTEASNTDGKAAICLQKLKLFRQFYIMVVCYIYFTRIIVYLISITVPFQYEWLDQLFKELATLIFFVITGYKFRPASDNPYLQVPTESDEEVEMEEVVTQTGMHEGLNRVNKKSEEGGTTLKQRECSHEYD